MVDTTPAESIRIPRQVVQLTPGKESSCATLLEPLLPAVEQLLLRLRLAEDPELSQRFPHLGSKLYPLGRCLQIRDAVFTRLQDTLNGKLPAPAEELPVLQTLHAYLAQGGICHKVWGSV